MQRKDRKIARLMKKPMETIPEELSRYLYFAFELRQNSDYGEVFTVNSKDAYLVFE